MDFNARRHATWRGEVPAADLAAMFAAVTSLNGLQQELEARRLAAQIEQSGHEWRVPLLLGPVAVLLWLADALRGLADDFYSGETSAAQGQSATVSVYTYKVVAALLLPIEDLLAAASALFADPTYPSPLVAPAHVGPGGDIADIALPRPPSMTYARSLLTGTTRLHTAASSTLLARRKETGATDAPPWLLSGMQRLDGMLRSAGTRLEIATQRLDASSTPDTPAPLALDIICRDFWAVVDTAIVAGQCIADPHLLTGAPPTRTPATQSPVLAVETPATQTTLPPIQKPFQAPLPTPNVRQRETPLALPQIDPGGAPLREHLPNPPEPSQFPAGAHPPAPFPAIGDTRPASGETNATPRSKQVEKQRSPKPARSADPTPNDDGPPVLFPKIG